MQLSRAQRGSRACVGTGGCAPLPSRCRSPRLQSASPLIGCRAMALATWHPVWLAPTTDQLARQLGELATWLIPGLQPPRPWPTCCGISSPPAPAVTAPELCSSSHHNPCALKHPPRDPAALRLPVPATTHQETPALIAK